MNGEFSFSDFHATSNVMTGPCIACSAGLYTVQVGESVVRYEMLFGTLAMGTKACINKADRVVREFRVFPIACIWIDLYFYVEVFIRKVQIERFWCVSR